MPINPQSQNTQSANDTTSAYNSKESLLCSLVEVVPLEGPGPENSCSTELHRLPHWAKRIISAGTVCFHPSFPVLICLSDFPLRSQHHVKVFTQELHCTFEGYILPCVVLSLNDCFVGPFSKHHSLAFQFSRIWDARHELCL